MSVGSLVLLLAALPAGPVPAAPAAPSPTLSSADEQTLKSANIPVAATASEPTHTQRAITTPTPEFYCAPVRATATNWYASRPGRRRPTA